MGAVRGCEFPEDLLYSVENNVWVRQESDGTATVGLTSYAGALAGTIVSYTPKKVGKSVKADKSCATVESGKWVGPAKTPVGGEVVETNDKVSSDPSMINNDPYGEGWLVKLKPDNWDGDTAELKTGQDALNAFEKKMEDEGFGGC